ncbi:hypothetical protein BJV77DRAFT_1153138 [Russula vinacea]|nr:hypothetical protein BJV77DRAFT_1153138 [Russula vinacea]
MGITLRLALRLAIRVTMANRPSAFSHVLQEQVRGIDRSGSGDKSWTLLLSPTVNVLVAISASVQEGVGLLLSPAKLIFVAIGILLSMAPAVSASQDRLIYILGRVGKIFRRLELKVTLPGSRKDINEEILLVVLSILTSATEDITQGRAKKYLKR